MSFHGEATAETLGSLNIKIAFAAPIKHLDVLIKVKPWDDTVAVGSPSLINRVP